MLGVSHPCGDFGASPSGRRIRPSETAIRIRPKKSISTNASLHAWVQVLHGYQIDSSNSRTGTTKTHFSSV